ncbi:MAG: XRE family transcriptional regulator [Candidatus Omnitrophica bacterium]|nr:XRE family transcriptional regulator [Candidatus Omnitrophota bacterium]
MKTFRSFQDRLKEDLKIPEFKKNFEDEEIFASLAIQISQLRQKQGLSQKELALRLKTTQQNVSRIENISNRSLSLNTLIKLAEALHGQLKIELT